MSDETALYVGDIAASDASALVKVEPPDDLTPGQLAVFSGMTPALQREAVEIRDMIRQECNELIDSRYALGERIVRVTADKKTYGPASDIQLSEFLGEDKTTVCMARRLVERYTREQIEEIKETQTATGKPLTVSHLYLLQRIADDAEANKVLELCTQSSWSINELRKYLDGLQGRQNRSPKSGTISPRKHVPHPTNFKAALTQIDAVTTDWLRLHKEVWSSELVDLYEKLKDEQVNDDIVNATCDAYKKLKQISEAVSGFAIDVRELSLRAAKENARRKQEEARPRRRPQKQDKADEEEDGDGDDD